MKKRDWMSRRVASLLVALFGALVVFHYASGAPNWFGSTPAVSSALKAPISGEITAMSASQLTLALTNAKGNLTKLTRTVIVSPQTVYAYPGQSDKAGAQGETDYLKVGYRVNVAGQAASNGNYQAKQVTVAFPAIQGTITSLKNNTLTLAVDHATQPMVMQLSANTALHFAKGQSTPLKTGLNIQVVVAPQTPVNQNSVDTPLQAVAIWVAS